MKDVFSSEQCDILTAASSGGWSYLQESGYRHADEPQAVVEIDGRRFPSPWTRESSRLYVDALRSLISGGFATELELIQTGIFRFRLTEKGQSISQTLSMPVLDRPDSV